MNRVQQHLLASGKSLSVSRLCQWLGLPRSTDRVKANLRFASGFLHCITNLAEQSGGLSGGDILNICLNAIHAGSRDPDPAKWLMTEAMLLQEIKRAKAAKEKHAGRRGGRRGIGFTA